jgi:hypothetical protein
MGLGARLAGIEFALLCRRCPACRAWDCKCLFDGKLLFHGEDIVPYKPGMRLVNFEHTQKTAPFGKRYNRFGARLFCIEGGSGVFDDDPGQAP